MGLLDGFKRVQKTTVKKSQQTPFDEIVDNTINTQIRIANGEVVNTTKRKSDGSYGTTPSWMKDGLVFPKVGIYPLLGNEGLEMTESDYKTWLISLKQGWRDDPEITNLLKGIEEKMKKAQESRRKSLDKKDS